jgi:UMF1 family MFS transporter
MLEDGMSTPQRIGWVPVIAWATYDLANTLFSFTVTSIFLPLWVVNDMGGRDADYGIASGLSMGLIFVLAPFLGALSDQARTRMPFLVITTLVCIVFTAPLGQGGLWTTLILFMIANFFYQAGVIFYDSLLPTVSTPATRGWIGGIGVGIGSIGALMGVISGLIITGNDPSAKPTLFQFTAVMFLILSLPCFFFVKERPRPIARPFGMWAVRAAVDELTQTARRVKQYRGLGRFLVGRVFYSDAANTMIAFTGIYVTNEAGFSQQQAQMVLGSGIICAILGGFIWGKVVDLIGPKKTLNIILGIWIVLLGLVAAIGGLGLPGWLFWIPGPLVGLCLSGTWAADRPLMLRLSPPRYLGQFYGLYAMVGRFAAIMGPLGWALIVDGLGWGRPAAVFSLMLMVIVSAIILRPVSDDERAWGKEDLIIEPEAEGGEPGAPAVAPA